MKFSENWLREHVAVAATHEQLIATLTAIGLEVEAVTALGAGLDGVVVARIVSASQHPQADRLQVCMVDAGQEQLLQIVCGAPNARAGLVAPLALVGTRLGEQTIQAATLRGVASNGMLCSARELGLDADAAGLLELPADAPVGKALTDYLGLPDTSIELKLTPNRADCFSVHGIAFDVAAALSGQVAALDVDPVAAASEAALAIELQAGADAPRYLGRVIEGVDASRPTPVWMAERLRRSGVRPVSLLVDITQYVMLEIGQPMHAFDRDLLQGPIGVRHGRAEEQVTLLDGRTVAIDPQFLVITDADQAVALAGVMGGQQTRVTEATRNVFLESAYFAPNAIIGRARRLGLHTDAAHRYERGVDPQLPRIALERATGLVLELAGGTPGPVLVAELPEHLPQPRQIPLRRARLARVLGMVVEDAQVERILHALGFAVTRQESGWMVSTPTRRFDLALEEDLIEEVARIHGYDHIPTSLPSGAMQTGPTATQTHVDSGSVRRQIVARDYLETLNYAFVEQDLLARWQMASGAIRLANPLSAELAVMRTALLPGLVQALARNQARQQQRLRLFELGNVFAATATPGEAPYEATHLAAVASGHAADEQWGVPARPLDFHDLKGDLDSVASLAGAVLEYRPGTAAHGHPGRSADVYRQGQRIGWLGQVHPRLQRALDLDSPLYAWEVDLALLTRRQVATVAAPSRYPSVRRDLAIVVPDEVPWDAVAASVRTAAGSVLRLLRLFDQYTGKSVEAGHKSLAMGLILQEDSRTLTEQEVDRVMAEVMARLRQDHAAQIRG